MFSRGVSRAKGGFMHMYEEEVSFQSQANGFARANSIISEKDVGHEEKSIAEVMDMIHIWFNNWLFAIFTYLNT